jgi:hypothetical protein
MKGLVRALSTDTLQGNMIARVGAPRDPIIWFDEFELDTVRRVLTRRGIRLKIQQQRREFWSC